MNLEMGIAWSICVRPPTAPALQANFFSRSRKGYVDQLEFVDHRLPAVRRSDHPSADGADGEGAPRRCGEASAVQGRPARLRRAAVDRRRLPRRLPHCAARIRSGTYTCNL